MLAQCACVQAAIAFGVPPLCLMARHVLQIVVHLGVDPSINRFGGMINLARTEMSRDPLPWWSFVAALGLMNRSGIRGGCLVQVRPGRYRGGLTGEVPAVVRLSFCGGCSPEAASVCGG